MTVAIHPTQIAIIGGVAALVIWRLYARVRQLIGRQQIRRRSLWIKAILFCCLFAWLLLGAIAQYGHSVFLVGGGMISAALALFGLRLTHFERQGDAHYYQPNAWLGMAVAALFIGRLLYRAVHLWLAGHDRATIAHQSAALTPATLAVLGLICSFYALQSFGLLRRHRQMMNQETRETLP